MLALALIATFLAVVLTGPAGKEWRERRKMALDAPKVTVLYLPSECCRGTSEG